MLCAFSHSFLLPLTVQTVHAVDAAPLFANLAIRPLGRGVVAAPSTYLSAALSSSMGSSSPPASPRSHPSSSSSVAADLSSHPFPSQTACATPLPDSRPAWPENCHDKERGRQDGSEGPGKRPVPAGVRTLPLSTAILCLLAILVQRLFVGTGTCAGVAWRQ
ncbi:hypothetical protein NGA_0424400, partial [Nannochloropsis gaditana CCMP526]|uniref:uncharacterized protein n=1 Tax=Nannochloropsis gaditana (strain CCMP526) TaxID=1093141 RepID=UPI00029F7D91